jgi:hypothetical protein
MSYDLEVYSQKSPSRDSLRELVAAVGLSVDDADGDADSRTVVRGAKGKYCFTLGLPVAVELEDVVPAENAIRAAQAAWSLFMKDTAEAVTSVDVHSGEFGPG